MAEAAPMQVQNLAVWPKWRIYVVPGCSRICLWQDMCVCVFFLVACGDLLALAFASWWLLWILALTGFTFCRLLASGFYTAGNLIPLNKRSNQTRCCVDTVLPG